MGSGHLPVSGHNFKMVGGDWEKSMQKGDGGWIGSGAIIKFLNIREESVKPELFNWLCFAGFLILLFVCDV